MPPPLVPSNPNINVFSHPYWQFNEDRNIIPVVPTGTSAPQELTPSDQAILIESIPGIAPGMDATPFFEIVVKNSPLGGTMITWGMKRTFADPLPYTFEVYWAETSTGPYIKVDAPTLINTYWAVDPEHRTFALDVESYYAIKLTTPNGEYWSYASSANSLWNKKDWLIGREICRKEFLMCRKFVGWYGFLLKRIVWGPTCTRCSDFDTNEPSDGHCDVCYGTGKDGGYWNPFPTFVYNLEGSPTQFKQVDDKVGLAENIVLPKMRMLGYPHLATNDVFVHYGSGRRFFIRPVHVVAEIKGMPIIYVCELRLAPYTDIIYEFPKIVAPPTPPPGPEPPESEPTYEQPPMAPTVKIQWAEGEWQLGEDLENVLYHTTAGYPLPNGLDSFTWVKEDGSASVLTFEEAADGWEIAGDPDVAGLYMPSGSVSGLPVYSRVDE